MQEARGVGLAAPQVGVLRRVLVYQTATRSPCARSSTRVIVASSEEQETLDEGCLSLGAASVVVPVARPATVTRRGDDSRRASRDGRGRGAGGPGHPA